MSNSIDLTICITKLYLHWLAHFFSQKDISHSKGQGLQLLSLSFTFPKIWQPNLLHENSKFRLIDLFPIHVADTGYAISLPKKYLNKRMKWNWRLNFFDNGWGKILRKAKMQVKRLCFYSNYFAFSLHLYTNKIN